MHSFLVVEEDGQRGSTNFFSLSSVTAWGSDTEEKSGIESFPAAYHFKYSRARLAHLINFLFTNY